MSNIKTEQTIDQAVEIIECQIQYLEDTVLERNEESYSDFLVNNIDEQDCYRESLTRTLIEGNIEIDGLFATEKQKELLQTKLDALKDSDLHRLLSLNHDIESYANYFTGNCIFAVAVSEEVSIDDLIHWHDLEIGFTAEELIAASDLEEYMYLGCPSESEGLALYANDDFFQAVWDFKEPEVKEPTNKKLAYYPPLRLV